MDTSDSEYFESADEEIYPDDDPSKNHDTKNDKLTSEFQKDLINLKLNESTKNTTSKQDLGIDIDINKAKNSSGTPLESERNQDNNFNIENKKNNKVMIEKLESDIENNTKYDTLGDKHEDNGSGNDDTVSNVTDTKFSETKALRNRHSNSNRSKTIIEKTDSNDVQQVVGEASDDEENMWENDDWEPINDDKVPSVSDVGIKNSKPLEEKDLHLGYKEELAQKNDMWDNDEWEPLEEVQPQKQDQYTEPSWSNWGNWGGMTSIITTATQGVSTLTQSLSTVIESSMGIPDPKELAKIDKEKECIVQEEEEEEVSNVSNVGFGFGNLSNLVSGVSHITKFVENTGSKVITGGLDTLETIGKKTMEVLQEGDPGLKHKRSLLKLDKKKPILSQVLREAKEKAEAENKVLQQTHSKKKLNYETLFDDYHGLVHLEALEMLSKQCDITLETLQENSSGSELQDLQETMDQIKELCELPDEDDDETSSFDDIKEKLQAAVQELNVSITYGKLISLWEETETWLNNLKLEFCGEEEIYQEALQVLAQLTAIAVEQFHKCGELLMIKDHRSTVDEADSLVQLTMTLTSLIGLAAGKFSEKLNAKSSQTGNKESINSLITNVFFEAGNSSSYIQDAFQLLVPVLQAGAMHND
ncbi:protein FAM114A2 [Diorhabda sublineata]|uniref:protein FAM114A2 n=1 Tax=Diorhabda sublineata TaxID=1163346 RepID=UPI0024E17DE4|nr:protein FAM114A2 [Diorhabda sublineata]